MDYRRELCGITGGGIVAKMMEMMAWARDVSKTALKSWKLDFHSKSVSANSPFAVSHNRTTTPCAPCPLRRRRPRNSIFSCTVGLLQLLRPNVQKCRRRPSPSYRPLCAARQRFSTSNTWATDHTTHTSNRDLHSAAKTGSTPLACQKSEIQTL